MENNNKPEQSTQIPPVSSNEDFLYAYVVNCTLALIKVFFSSVFLYLFWNKHLVFYSFYRLPSLNWTFFPTFLISLWIVSKTISSGFFSSFPAVIFTNTIDTTGITAKVLKTDISEN